MAAGRQMLITAGPTHEPIDAVRYIANRSSGRLGVALAVAAAEAQWTVRLLLGPVCTEPPANVAVNRFTTAAELASLLEQYFPACDVLIMAAAVADYAPVQSGVSKMERQAGPATLELQPTADLVAGCAAIRRPEQRIIGFALEDEQRLEHRASEKLRRKKLDAIVANPLRTMGADAIDAVLMFATGEAERPGPMSKNAFARWLIARLS